MSQILAMATFSLVMSLSPGPVNFITLSSGLNHGFARTFPFVTGATVGFTLLLAGIGFGLGELMTGDSQLLSLLGYAGSVFLCYLGYRIASAPAEIETTDSPTVGFLEGVGLQWLNPKAWMACLAGVSAFNLLGTTGDLLLFLSIYFIVCYLSISAWGFVGTKARHFLGDARLLKLMNFLLGGSLILIAVYLQLMQTNVQLSNIAYGTQQYAAGEIHNR